MVAAVLMFASLCPIVEAKLNRALVSYCSLSIVCDYVEFH